MRRQESERAEPHATAIAGREGLCARPHGQLHAPKALIFKRSFVGSAVQYATNMLHASRSATGRENKPSIRKIPPTNSRVETKGAAKPGNGILRLAKNPVIFAKLCTFPHPVWAN